MIPKEIFQKIRRIQIRSSHQVDELLAGSWNSAFKGRGIEFEEVRPYQVGDDVRSIDWNVTARSDQPFVKLFRDCLLYTSPSPRDQRGSRMPSSA